MSFPLLFASSFMSIFSIVIAFFKDIPDVKGDKGSSIQTLSVRLGVRQQNARLCATADTVPVAWQLPGDVSRAASPVCMSLMLLHASAQERTVLNICVALLLVAYAGCGLPLPGTQPCVRADTPSCAASQRGGCRSLLPHLLVPLRPRRRSRAHGCQPVEGGVGDRHLQRCLADGDVHVHLEALLRRVLPAAAVRPVSVALMLCSPLGSEAVRLGERPRAPNADLRLSRIAGRCLAL